MKLVVIFGPLAVGKMTVGQELAKLTGLKLFHNHMTIDLVANFFDYGTEEGSRLVHLFRTEIFQAVAKSDLPGMIFTYVWAFDQPADRTYLEKMCAPFVERGAEIYYVELEADYDVRFARNSTENRLLNKPTKRDITWSEANFKRTEAKYRLNSLPGEVEYPNYIRIDNTDMPPEEAARRIVEAFSL
jgi:shikimate kinase